MQKRKHLKSEREYNWKRQGIVGYTFEKHLELIRQQSYQCAICEKLIDESAPVHIHPISHEVLSVLCIKCRSGLTAFNHNSELLRKAAFYIEGDKI